MYKGIVYESCIYEKGAKFMKKTWRATYKIRQAIKESFDNLPSGICFFDEKGLPVLCNLKMQQLIFKITGQNLQSIYDIESLRQISKQDGILSEYSAAMSQFKLKKGEVSPECSTNMSLSKLEKRNISPEYNTDIFLLTLQKKEIVSEEIWQFQKEIIAGEQGECYTQVVAFDVTELYKKREELVQENEKLKKEQERMKLLSQNIEEVTRQEEILNAKMDVHRQMGESLARARQILRGEGK